MKKFFTFILGLFALILAYLLFVFSNILSILSLKQKSSFALYFKSKIKILNSFFNLIFIIIVYFIYLWLF